MKSLLIGAALAASLVPTTVAAAHPSPEPHRHDDLIAVNVDPQGGSSREAFAFRQCRKAGGDWGRYVCYDTTRTSWISIAGILPVPITRTKTRVHQVDCTRNHLGNSLRAQVAAEYCPKLPGLAPAPFLSLRD